MTYDMYRYIFIGAAILCGIMLVASIITFIVLKIPKIIGDLSGATARKAIKNIREQNESTGDKSYKVSAVNASRGKLTDKITPSGNIIHQYQTQMRLGIETQELEDNQTTVIGVYDETSVLSSYNETSVLGNAGETSVLDNNMYDETSVLTGVAANTTFNIEYEITLIHTNEIISMEGIR